MKILILYESLTGNTRSFVDYLLDRLGWTPDVKIDVVTFSEFAKEDHLKNLSKYDIIFLGTYTWGSGKIPTRVKRIIIQEREELMSTKVFLFGSGITIYANFCGALDGISTILDKEDIPKIKYELTFLPEENLEGIKVLDGFLSKNLKGE